MQIKSGSDNISCSINDILNVITDCHDKDLINDILSWLICLKDKSMFLAALGVSHEYFNMSQAWRLAFLHDCEELVKPFMISKSLHMEERLQTLSLSTAKSSTSPTRAQHKKFGQQSTSNGGNYFENSSSPKSLFQLTYKK